jgi:AraC-like DNA-binding protein
MREELQLPRGPGVVFHYQPRGRLHPRHSHAELELNLVERGQARWLVDDRCHRIVRGSLVWLLPGREHLLVDLSPDFAMWIAVIRPDRLARWCGAGHALRARTPPADISGVLARSDASRLEGLLAELSRLPHEGRRFEHGLAYAVLSAWQAFQAAGRTSITALPPAVEAAVASLRLRDQDLDSLAASVGLSTSRLRHLVRGSLGESLLALRNRFRVERFLACATDPRRRLDHCALEAGFGTYVQCHRVVRRLLGVNPSTWRRGFVR